MSEKRDEWFETNHDRVPHRIRVDNTSFAPGQVRLRINRIGYSDQSVQTFLTPDEARQLATMLNLAAKGLE